jgi:NTE family protein
MVLSGGGSRGAYEAGVLLYLRERLPARLGHPARIDILSGTSVGAINAAFLAATMDRPETQAQRLCEMWRALRIEKMVRVDPIDLLRSLRLLLGGSPPAPEPGSYRHGGLLETAGLERFVLRQVPWRAIRRNLRGGALRALAVSATHIASGDLVVFVDSADPLPATWSDDALIRRQRVRIGPRHVLAAAAIPILMASVKIGDAFYTDGGLRLRTPMSPAIRLGAERLLVVSLRHRGADSPPAPPSPRDEPYPRPLFLAGKALNAMLLDHTGYDLDRMVRINLLLEEGERLYGADFGARMNAALAARGAAPVRRLEAVHIHPSEDIGAMAADFVRRGAAHVRGRLTRRILQRLALGESPRETDLLSYFLFDGDFTASLIDLGYRDASQREDDLVRLFRRSAEEA